MGNRLKAHSSAFVCAFVSSALLVGVSLGSGTARDCFRKLFKGKEKITVVVSLIDASDPLYPGVGRDEKSVGERQVAPALKRLGYEVGEVLSAHDTIEDGFMSPNGPLRDHLNKVEPNTDSARVLFVTIFAAKTGEDEFSSAVVLLDTEASEMASYRPAGLPRVAIKWNHENVLKDLNGEQLVAAWTEEIQQGIEAYDAYRKAGGAK